MHPSPADVFIIAVPTPVGVEKNPDLSYVKKAVKNISSVIEPGNMIILESTVPPGTTNHILEILRDLRPEFFSNKNKDEKIFIAHCPERVLPGKILKEIVENDRIVGGLDPISTQEASKFYQTFVKGEVVGTDSKTAEMSKLIENSFRDVNIAFANELSMLCDNLDIDVRELISLCNRHPRVDILKPGPGVGGHCLAVDPWFVVNSSQQYTSMIETGRKINDDKTLWVAQKIIDMTKSLKNPVIGCLGVTYKPNSDDLRESPALKVIKLIKESGLKVLACDPNIEKSNSVTLVNAEELLKSSNVVVALVKHDLFLKIKREQLNRHLVLDTCGLFSE